MLSHVWLCNPMDCNMPGLIAVSSNYIYIYIYIYIYLHTHTYIWYVWKWKWSCSDVSDSLHLCNPMDCSPPGFSVHGILQARILEWVASSFYFIWLLWVLAVICRIFDLHWDVLWDLSLLYQLNLLLTLSHLSANQYFPQNWCLVASQNSLAVTISSGHPYIQGS